MAHLQSSETRACCDSFLQTLFGSKAYSKWQRLKSSMNFTLEEDFVSWMLEFIDSHNNISYEEEPVEYLDGEHDFDNSASGSNTYEYFKETHLIKGENVDECYSGNVDQQQLQSNCDMSVKFVSTDPLNSYQPLPISMDCKSGPKSNNRKSTKYRQEASDIGHVNLETNSAAAGHESLSIQDDTEGLGDESIEFNEAYYQCNQCDATFSTSLARMTHHRVHHADSLDCGMCGKQFNKKSHLYRHHDAVHRKVKNYWCHYCGKRFALKQHLKVHIAVHEKIM